MKNVIDIDSYRANSGPRAHAEGKAFALTHFIFHEDAVGTLPEAVVVITDPEGLTGLFMSKDDAFRLARAVTFAAGELP